MTLVLEPLVSWFGDVIEERRVSVTEYRFRQEYFSLDDWRSLLRDSPPSLAQRIAEREIDLRTRYSSGIVSAPLSGFFAGTV
jgi:hypothetical protein